MSTTLQCSGPGRAIVPLCMCVRTTTFELNDCFWTKIFGSLVQLNSFYAKVVGQGHWSQDDNKCSFWGYARALRSDVFYERTYERDVVLVVCLCSLC